MLSGPSMHPAKHLYRIVDSDAEDSRLNLQMSVLKVLLLRTNVHVVLCDCL